MLEGVIQYIIIGVVGILCVFAIVVGVEQMIRVTLGNYILMCICAGLSEAINLTISLCNQAPAKVFLGISYETYSSFLLSGKTTIVLIIYILLLVFIFKKSKIHIRLPEEHASYQLFYALLVPLTVTSVVLTLLVVILGVSVLDAVKLQTLARGITTNEFMITMIRFTPLWFAIHGIMTIVISSELRMTINTDSI